MAETKKYLLSIVVPLFNESAGLETFHKLLIQSLPKSSYEIIYVDDGSTDKTSTIVRRLCEANPNIRLIRFSRNFGKEIATTAGINEAVGDAILMLDADGQHPPELITQFVDRWLNGAKVIVGLRLENQKEGFIKRYGSKLFYKIFNLLTGLRLLQGSTDFRLINKSIARQFRLMTERNRITRGLIDWVGYDCEYIKFKANPRIAGEASYSPKKLFKLAIDTIISLSLSPLYISAYIGAFILPVSLVIGLVMAVNALAGDPLSLDATGTAYLTILILFLIGILLVSQGIIGIYLSRIHTETQNRPLYIVDEENSIKPHAP